MCVSVCECVYTCVCVCVCVYVCVCVCECVGCRTLSSAISVLSSRISSRPAVASVGPQTHVWGWMQFWVPC